MIFLAACLTAGASMHICRGLIVNPLLLKAAVKIFERMEIEECIY